MLENRIVFDKNANQYYNNLLQDIVKHKVIAIWGSARGGKGFLEYLFDYADVNSKSIFFVDNDKTKLGSYCGIDVKPPEALMDYSAEDTIVVITCAAYYSVKNQLSTFYDGDIVLFDCAWNEKNREYIDFYNENKEAFDEAFNLFSDKLSQDTFVGIVNYRINHSPAYLEKIISSQNEYFDSLVVNLSDNEVFVDGGAYNGDTIMALKKATNDCFKKAICFEPSADNFQRLKEYSSNDSRIICYDYGLGADDKISYLDTKSNNGHSSCYISDDGDLMVQEKTLDSICENEEISFLKLDIEGYEKMALNGAKKTISKSKPILAICVYHRYEDLIEIPRLIKSLDISYALFLRHYSITAFESICYAIPKERL